jgi:hypothetical protein
MARGKKTGGRNFKPGVVTNPNGRPPLPPELKELRAQRQTDLELSIYKYTNMSLDELKKEFAKPEKSAIDLLVMKCLIKAIEKGDFSWVEPMLVRSHGKVTDKIQVDASLQVQSVHDHIIREIEADDK